MVKKRYTDVYAEKERKYMYAFQRIKDKILSPITKILIKLNITPNMLSYSSVLLGIAFLIFIKIDQWIAFWFIVGAMVFDTFDGTLARASKNRSLSGSLVDESSDQMVILMTTVGFIWIGLAIGWIAVIYIFTYTALVAMAAVRNALKIPYKWILRPRIWIYILFWVYLITGFNLINYAMIIFSVIMLIPVLTGFFKIKEVV